MPWAMSLSAIAVAYLLGSINFAVIVTRIAVNSDIRELGNKNPGMANVMRNVGKLWGILVAVLDGLKGLVPVLAARALFLDGGTSLDSALLYAIAIAAVLGHCKSIFMGFTGGGGIATMQGVSLYFVPVEFLAAMLIGGAFVLIFVKKKEFRFGQVTPIFFVTLTPVIALIASLLVDVPLFGDLSIGGHDPGLIVGCFAMSLVLLALNASFLKRKVR
jgi:glycerol-3-phosphate acyltransferase PlsY